MDGHLKGMNTCRTSNPWIDHSAVIILYYLHTFLIYMVSLRSILISLFQTLIGFNSTHVDSETFRNLFLICILQFVAYSFVATSFTWLLSCSFLPQMKNKTRLVPNFNLITCISLGLDLAQSHWLSGFDFNWFHFYPIRNQAITDWISKTIAIS